MKITGCFAAFLGTLALIGAGCDTVELSTCDVAERSCQEEIYYSMLKLRNDGYDPFAGLPPIRVITEAEFRNELLAEASSNPNQAPSPWDSALSLLHLYPPAPSPSDGGVGDDGGTVNTEIDDQATHVYAYYDPRAKNVTVIAHPQLTGVAAQQIAMESLAHEFVHALQDREMDLEATDKAETSDEYLAASTVIEGDARFYETIFTGTLVKRFSTPNLLKAIDYELEYYFTHFDELGSPFFAAQMFMYPLGAKYFATRWASDGNPAVRRAYGKAPKNTVGLLLNPDGSSPPNQVHPMACDAPWATGLNPVGLDRFGALVFYSFLRGWQVDHATAYGLAQGWTDDQIVVFQSADKSTVAVAWRVDIGRSMPSPVLTALSSTGELSLSPNGTALTIMAKTSGKKIDWQATPGCL